MLPRPAVAHTKGDGAGSSFSSGRGTSPDSITRLKLQAWEQQLEKKEKTLREMEGVAMQLLSLQGSQDHTAVVEVKSVVSAHEQRLLAVERENKLLREKLGSLPIGALARSANGH